MDCNSCKEGKATVPYIVHEGEMARMERSNKRWFVAWLITFLLLVGCVSVFMWYESQWEVVSTMEISQENTDGNNNYIGNNGSIYNGEADDQNY